MLCSDGYTTSIASETSCAVSYTAEPLRHCMQNVRAICKSVAINSFSRFHCRWWHSAGQYLIFSVQQRRSQMYVGLAALQISNTRSWQQPALLHMCLLQRSMSNLCCSMCSNLRLSGRHRAPQTSESKHQSVPVGTHEARQHMYEAGASTVHDNKRQPETMQG